MPISSRPLNCENVRTSKWCHGFYGRVTLPLFQTATHEPEGHIETFEPYGVHEGVHNTISKQHYVCDLVKFDEEFVTQCIRDVHGFYDVQHKERNPAYDEYPHDNCQILQGLHIGL